MLDVLPESTIPTMSMSLIFAGRVGYGAVDRSIRLNDFRYENYCPDWMQ